MSDESGPADELPEDDGILEPADSLEDDDLSDDPLDAGIEPPDHWSAAEGFGNTLEEARRGESLDQHLAEEEPDVGADGEGEGDYGEQDEDLQEPEGGYASADDGGYLLGERSAEQAAMHVIEEALPRDEEF